MVADDMSRLLATLSGSLAFAHPLILDVALGTLYGVAIGLALSALRARSR